MPKNVHCNIVHEKKLKAAQGLCNVEWYNHVKITLLKSCIGMLVNDGDKRSKATRNKMEESLK